MSPPASAIVLPSKMSSAAIADDRAAGAAGDAAPAAGAGRSPGVKLLHALFAVYAV